MVKKDGKKVRFCLGLNSDEFKCRCSYDFCQSIIITKDLINAYLKFRKLVGVKLRINSGYRCVAHNMDVGGRPLSRHTSGQAIDIDLKSLNHLHEDDIEHAAKTAGFTYIKFYKTFVHMDVR